MSEEVEPIIPIFPKDDYHRLLFAMKYIECLKQERDELQDEVNSLHADLIKLGKDGSLLSSYKKEMKSMREGMRKWRE